MRCILEPLITIIIIIKSNGCIPTCEKFGSSSTIPGLSGWFGICRTNVPAGGVYSAGPGAGGRGGEVGRDFREGGCGAKGCGLGDRQLLGLPSRLAHDCSTCSLSSAGKASNTERSTLHIIEEHMLLKTFNCSALLKSIKHFLQVLTCDGEGISILKLRRARECFGVCLHVCWSLLVPGTGSGGDIGCGEEPDDRAVVDNVIS